MPPVPPLAPKLLDQERDTLRLKHYSMRAEVQYVQWVKCFIRFHGKRCPLTLGVSAVEVFLTHPAVQGKEAESAQNPALSALLFLYREVLAVDLPWLDGVVRAVLTLPESVILTPEPAARTGAAG